MGRKFVISVRKIEDAEIEVTPAELAAMLGIDEATLAARLDDAAPTMHFGDDVLGAVLLPNRRTAAGEVRRRTDTFTDEVTTLGYDKPDRMKWIKTDRVVDSVVMFNA